MGRMQSRRAKTLWWTRREYVQRVFGTVFLIDWMSVLLLASCCLPERVTDLILETSHPLAIAALHTADPDCQPKYRIQAAVHT
jgi:hypothetical protein